MIKVTVLYGHPTNPTAFENYYANTHMPIALSMKGVNRMEFTKFIPGPEGAIPAYYRMAELVFTDPGAMQQTMESPEGKATSADLANFATGGVTFMFGMVEN